MIASRKFISGLAAALVLGVLTGGCDSGLGVKEVFLGKPAPSPNLRENGKLIMPPPNAPLPPPGQGMNRQWPVSTEGQQQAADAAPKKDESSGWFSGIFGSGDAKKTQ